MMTRPIADRRQDDDPGERLERLVRRRTDAGREELAQDDTEDRPGHGAPGERHEDDADGLVLVDVRRVEVHDEEERDEEGARDQRDREVPGRRDRDDHDDPRDERDPERILVGRWQTREDRRRESNGSSGLTRVGRVPARVAGPQRLSADRAERARRHRGPARRARDEVGRARLAYDSSPIRKPRNRSDSDELSWARSSESIVTANVAVSGASTTTRWARSVKP